jgi:hypothetical protein
MESSLKKRFRCVWFDSGGGAKDSFERPFQFSAGTASNGRGPDEVCRIPPLRQEKLAKMGHVAFEGQSKPDSFQP